MTKKIAVIVGSNSETSINRKLARALMKLGKEKAEFQFLEIANLPIHNRDLTDTPPAEVTKFKEDAGKFDAFLILTPEYNRSIPALLKNAIDWGSKPQETSIWRKPIIVSGTSPGAIGTSLAQEHLKSIFLDIGGPILPGHVFLTFKPDMIDDDGNITIEGTQKFLQGFIDKAVAFVEKQAQ